MYRNPYTNDPAVAGRDGTTANTNAVFHAGRLFALKEDGLPHELDPDTLETRGKYRYGGKLQSHTFTAHPKIDPATGQMLAHGYEARGLATRDVALQVISRSGQLEREEFFLAPYVSFMHDWAVTAGHFIFPDHADDGGRCAHARRRRALDVPVGPGCLLRHHAPRRRGPGPALVPHPQLQHRPCAQRVRRRRQGVRGPARQRTQPVPVHRQRGRLAVRPRQGGAAPDALRVRSGQGR